MITFLRVACIVALVFLIAMIVLSIIVKRGGKK